MKTYLAITLGPIFKTLIRQRRTRSIFSASYLFSYIMRELMKQLIEQDADCANNILTPSANFLDHDDYRHIGCGIYSDQLIMEGKAGSLETFERARGATIEHLLEAFGTESLKSRGYLEQYLKIYAIEVEMEPNDQTFKTIKRYLDQVELFENFPIGPDEDLLQSFFHQKSGHFIFEDAFSPDSANKGERFDTLAEIATRTFARLDSEEKRKEYSQIIWEEIVRHILKPQTEETEEEVDQFYEKLEQAFPEEYRDYHKYIAIVNVDGDSFGNYIASFGGSKEQYQTFSDSLFAFVKEANRLIREYGGTPVYIGGDDMLFFAPVACLNAATDQFETIFHLVNTLDKEFFRHFPAEKHTPTLSYGISISYHKYPMNEALIESYGLLDQAKNKGVHQERKKHPNKNAIAFKILKHSGQFFEAVIAKDKPGEDKRDKTVYQHFLGLLDAHITGNSFINSLTHGMAFFQDILVRLLVEDKDAESVRNLFANNLNEGIHNLNRSFIDAVVEFVIAVFAHQRDLDQKNPKVYQCYDGSLSETDKADKRIEAIGKDGLAIIYSTLRFIHFIRSSRTQAISEHA